MQLLIREKDQSVHTFSQSTEKFVYFKNICQTIFLPSHLYPEDMSTFLYHYKKWLYLQEEVEITAIQRNLRGVSELMALVGNKHSCISNPAWYEGVLLLVYFRKAGSELENFVK